ncbi:MAG: hypothetical protein FD127_4404 [Acidimicrobiaceae bacterium]|nr:MAG: hypothetical protein FD127_4404 [Acidimicrobiaceae bacterium]
MKAAGLEMLASLPLLASAAVSWSRTVRVVSNALLPTVTLNEIVPLPLLPAIVAGKTAGDTTSPSRLSKVSVAALSAAAAPPELRTLQVSWKLWP